MAGGEAEEGAGSSRAGACPYPHIRLQYEHVMPSAFALNRVGSCAGACGDFLPLCALQMGKRVDSITMIYDCEGLGLRHLWKPAVETYIEVRGRGPAWGGGHRGRWGRE